MFPPDVGTSMGGDAFAVVKDFNGGGGELGVDGLTAEAARDAVVVEVDFDVIVDVDSGLFPFGEFVGTAGERESGGVIDLVEELTA